MPISFHLPDSAPAQSLIAAETVPAQPATTAAGRREALQPTSVRRTVKSITVSGLSDQSRADLLSQLPVQEGDTLSAELLQNISRVSSVFDEHLVVRVMPVGSTVATLEVMIPGQD